MARVIWSPRAANDLQAICQYIERGSGYYARLVAERIVAAVEMIADFPEAGSIVPEYESPLIRERLVHRYRIVHRISGDTVEIVTIAHGSAQLPRLKELE